LAIFRIFFRRALLAGAHLTLGISYSFNHGARFVVADALLAKALVVEHDTDSFLTVRQ
jgi:hypothetical protein